MTILYVIYAEGKYKVGITGNLYKRIKQLQTGNGDLLQLQGQVELPTRECALAIEKYIHDKLCESNTIGEWFDTSRYEIAVLLEGLGYFLEHSYDASKVCCYGTGDVHTPMYRCMDGNTDGTIYITSRTIEQYCDKET